MQNICNFKFKINYKIILSNTLYSKFQTIYYKYKKNNNNKHFPVLLLFH